MKTVHQIYQIVSHNKSDGVYGQFIPITEQILKPIEHPEFTAAYQASNFLASNNSKLPKGDYVVLSILKKD